MSRAAFSEDFQTGLRDLMRWRRDVRRFRTDPVDEATLRDCLDTFLLAPSVGLSEPWRVVELQSPAARAAALANYRAANARALAGYDGDTARLYSNLKLSGCRRPRCNWRSGATRPPTRAQGLVSQTMPEMRRYSVVGAVTQFWLAARAQGLGVGWVSILDPEALARDLDIPADWALVAYLCVGWPEETSDTPELEQAGWETRRASLPREVR